ncbi:tributyrin esterase [Rhodopirellula sp.]|nr:tributyrin esterase [Rubripirellula sp.]MDB4423041.1 tributyrin esterase [Rhodopirellula sp.]MDB4624476.1 tributyrin esterase [Rubripirellula sp.]
MNQTPDFNPTVVGSGSQTRSYANGLSLNVGAKVLHQAIHEIPVGENDEQLTQVDVAGSAGQDSVLMRLNHPIRIKMEGPLGDYAFAFNSQADIRMTGNVGSGVAEGMASGAVRVRGDAGVGAGAAMTGGTLAIYGNAGNRCGAAMRGGGIFVRGNVGDETGVGALGGMIVIGGDAGHNLGDAMSNATVFIRGAAASLAAGVTDAPLRKREQLRLGLLLINASIRGDAKEFRRIVPTAMLEAEASERGELNPNWR